MTDAQAKFLEISKRLETLREEVKALQPTLEELMIEIGVDTMFQDPSTMLVYQIEEPTGTYITFQKVSYKRTKKAGETKGSLSKTDAEAAGFTLASNSLT
jgi:hypothetical protein